MELTALLAGICTTVGLLAIFHAGYSVHHFRSLVSIIHDGSRDASFDASVDLPPFDVVIEVLVGFTLILIGKLMPIKVHYVRYGKKTNLRKYEESYARPDFAPVSNRAHLFRQRIAKDT
tara:strand:+ start:2896 stop:3252 length:357 start_codon:yes stop_codon:yes gene_type:complete